MITPELFKQALKEAHVPCKGGCIHADAATTSTSEIDDAINHALDRGQRFDNAQFSVYYSGLHAGYRLHQLEMEQPINPTTAN